ncbi:MAG: hypothetical protein RLZZ324_948 [Candidatus Parcubacteria bacterium]|jgi:hypothetical protein
MERQRPEPAEMPRNDAPVQRPSFPEKIPIGKTCVQCGHAFPVHGETCAYSGTKNVFELKKAVDSAKNAFLQQTLQDTPFPERTADTARTLIDAGLLPEMMEAAQEGAFPPSALTMEIAQDMLKRRAAFPETVGALLDRFNETDRQPVAEDVLARQLQLCAEAAAGNAASRSVLNLQWLQKTVSEIDYPALYRMLDQEKRDLGPQGKERAQFDLAVDPERFAIPSEQVLRIAERALDHGYVEGFYQHPKMMLVLSPEDRKAFMDLAFAKDSELYKFQHWVLYRIQNKGTYVSWEKSEPLPADLLATYVEAYKNVVGGYLLHVLHDERPEEAARLEPLLPLDNVLAIIEDAGEKAEIERLLKARFGKSA